MESSIPEIYIDTTNLSRASYDTRETSYISHISRMSSDFGTDDFEIRSCSFQDITPIPQKKRSKFKAFWHRLFNCKG